MLPKKTISDLDTAILIFEIKKIEDERRLKEQFHVVYEGLKPVNIILKAIGQVAESRQIKTDLLQLSISFVARYISDRLVVRDSYNPLARLLGFALTSGISTILTKNISRVLNSKIL
jgi:hypothetical protein